MSNMTRFWPCADLAIAKLWLGHWPEHTSKHTPNISSQVKEAPTSVPLSRLESYYEPKPRLS